MGCNLTHLKDTDKRIGIASKGDLVLTAFLGKTIGLNLFFGHILRGLIETLTNLGIKGFHLLPQAFQLFFLTPGLTGNTLILGDVGTETFIAFLVLLDDTGYLLKCIDTITDGSKTIVLAHGKPAIVILIEVVALHIELVTGIYLFLQLIVIYHDVVNHQWETINVSHLAVFVTDGTTGFLKGGTHLFDVISTINRELADIFHCKAGEGSAILTIHDMSLKTVIVRCHSSNDRLVLDERFSRFLQTPLGITASLHIGLALGFQCENFLFELRLLQQIIIAGQDSDILRKVHSVLFIHSTLVNDTGAQLIGLQLSDEELLVLQKIELVTVKGALDGVNDNVYMIAAKLLGNPVAGTTGTAITLLQVRRTPRDVYMMDGNGTLLSIDTGAKGAGRTKKHPYLTFIHQVYHLLLDIIAAGLLDETDFIDRDAIVTDKLVFNLLEDVPLVGLIGAQIAEDELRTLLLIELLVVLGNKTRTMTGLVVRVIIKQLLRYQTHIKGGFPAGIGGDEHLSFLLTLIKRSTEDKASLTALGKLNQTLVEILLVCSWLYVMKNDIHIRTVETNILTSAVVGDFIVEGGQLRHLQKISETFLLHNSIGDAELII